MKSVSKSILAALLAGAMLFGFAGAASAQDPDAPSIGEIVAGDADFSTLGTALDLTGLTATFTDCEGGPFTVLAPNNDAFTTALDALGLTVADLAADPELVATILQYHVVEGAVTSDVVAGLDGTAAPTLQGESLTVAVDGDTISLVSGNPTPANVIAADVQACNGVVHVIDNVLLPPTVAEALGLPTATPAEDEPAEEAPAEEAPAEEELANTGASSAFVAIVAAAILAGGLMTLAAARPAVRTRRR